MKRLMIVLAILAILASLCGSSTALAAREVVKGAPGYARVLGVVIGWSATKDLEARIGRGKVHLGGHAGTGRYWRFRKCELTALAFERPDNSPMIGLFTVDGDKRQLSTIYPFSRDKRWPLRNLVFGESMSSCEAKMKRAGITMIHTGSGLYRVDIRKIIVGKLTYYQRYDLSLTGGKYLGAITITAQPTDNPKKPTPQ